MYEYKARVVRVVDGDTMDVSIDLGFGVYKRERIRLAGINTPETFGVKKTSDEYAAGMAAKEFVQSVCPVDSIIVIRTDKDKQGKYGRYIAYVFYHDSGGDEPNHLCLNETLLAAGHAEKVDY